MPEFNHVRYRNFFISLRGENRMVDARSTKFFIIFPVPVEAGEKLSLIVSVAGLQYVLLTKRILLRLPEVGILFGIRKPDLTEKNLEDGRSEKA